MTVTNPSRPLGAPVVRLDPRELTRAAASTSVPWTREQVATLCLVDVVAIAVILFGAWQAHAHQTTSHALGWLGVALLGLAVSGSMHMIWFMRGRRVLSLAIDAITSSTAVSSSQPNYLKPGVTAAGQSETTLTLPRLGSRVHVPGSSRYHLPDCAFVVGRSTVEVDPGMSASALLQPCEVCQP